MSLTIELLGVTSAITERTLQTLDCGQRMDMSGFTVPDAACSTGSINLHAKADLDNLGDVHV